MDKSDVYTQLLSTPGVPELIGTTLIVGILIGTIVGVLLAWLCITISLGRMRRRVNQSWKKIEEMHTCMRHPGSAKVEVRE